MKLVNKETDGRIYLYCFMINFDLNNKHQCAIIVHSFVRICLICRHYFVENE